MDNNNTQAIALSFHKLVAADFNWKPVAKETYKTIKQLPAEEIPKAAWTAINAMIRHIVRKEKITVASFLAQHPEYLQYKEQIYAIASTTTYNQEVVELLKELKKNGVLLVLATDQSPDTSVIPC